MSRFWEGRRVTVTGGAGFLGTHLIRRLETRGCTNLFVPRRVDYDLTTESSVERLYRDSNPDLVFHLAASVGGIEINRKHPGSYFYNNLMMGSLLLEHARRSDVAKFVGIGSVCAYPKFAEVPFREEQIWDGYPEETNAPYGLAKKMMMVQTLAYAEEYGYNAIHLLMVNLYGPGDDFDPESSHVIPALIKRCVEAKKSNQPELVVWGDGSPTREFLYVEDAVEGILLAAEHCDSPDPVNLGSGMEISIRDLASKICEIVAYEGRLVFDSSKPNGQPRRCLDVSKAESRFGFRAKTDFNEGLTATIRWYNETIQQVNTHLINV